MKFKKNAKFVKCALLKIIEECFFDNKKIDFTTPTACYRVKI